MHAVGDAVGSAARVLRVWDVRRRADEARERLTDGSDSEGTMTSGPSVSGGRCCAGVLHAWRHPAARLSVVLMLAFLNLVMFVEDPCSFAQTEAELPLVGNMINLVLRNWPPDVAPCVMKVLLLGIGLPLGFVLGRFVLHHWLLRNTLRLRMFHEDNGTLLAEGVGVGLVGVVLTLLWDDMLAATHGKEYAAQFAPKPGLGISDETFAFLVQLLTATGDAITIVMLLDAMLQDTSQYPDWCSRTRNLWRKRGIRLSVTWCVIPVLVMAQMRLVVWSQDWDIASIQTECGRSMIAALIFMLDLFTVCQDWEFPYFDNPLEVNIVGWDAPDLNLGCPIPKCPCRDACTFRFSGKWVNYGPMIGVMLLDVNNLANQWRYGTTDPPPYYGQYLDADGWIWTVQNASIATALREGLQRNPGFQSPVNRGPCIQAIPFDVGAPMADSPPCFPADYRVTGRVQKLDWLDFALPAAPTLAALIVFFVGAYRIPLLRSERLRREELLAAAAAKREGRAARLESSESLSEQLVAWPGREVVWPGPCSAAVAGGAAIGFACGAAAGLSPSALESAPGAVELRERWPQSAGAGAGAVGGLRTFAR